MDVAGKVVVAKQFSKPSDFINGLALVRIGDIKTGTEGYIDKTGKFVWKK